MGAYLVVMCFLFDAARASPVFFSHASQVRGND